MLEVGRERERLPGPCLRVGDRGVGLRVEVLIHGLRSVLCVAAGREVYLCREGGVGAELRVLLVVSLVEEWILI